MANSPINVLLIEDDPAARRLVERTLGSSDENVDFSIDFAPNLKDAKKFLACKDFDSVLLDLHLPDSRGLDTINSVREVAPDIPIIVLSAISDHETGIRAIQQGADYYLVKGQFMREMLGRSICFSIVRRKNSESRANAADLGQQSDEFKAKISALDTELTKANSHRKQLHGRLVSLKKKFDSIFNSIPAMIWLKDLDGKIVAANKQAAEFSKVAVKELIGKDFYDVFKDVFTLARDDDQLIIATGKPLATEAIEIQMDFNESSCFEVDRVPYRDDSDSVVGILVFARPTGVANALPKEEFKQDVVEILQEYPEPECQDDTAGASYAKRILIVENDPLNQMLLNLHLNNFNFDIVTVDNGQKAVDVIAKERFDLILMDIRMPVMDGYDATREIRKKGFDTPIIAITADVVNDGRQRCIDAGCDDFLSKPLIKKEFYDMIGGYLGVDVGSKKISSESCIEI